MSAELVGSVKEGETTIGLDLRLVAEPLAASGRFIINGCVWQLQRDARRVVVLPPEEMTNMPSGAVTVSTKEDLIVLESLMGVPGSQFLYFTDLGLVLDEMSAIPTAKTGSRSTIDGQSAEEFLSQDGASGRVIWKSRETGDPLRVQPKAGSDSSGQLDFRGWGQSKAVTTPLSTRETAASALEGARGLRSCTAETQTDG